MFVWALTVAIGQQVGANDTERGALSSRGTAIRSTRLHAWPGSGHPHCQSPHSALVRRQLGNALLSWGQRCPVIIFIA